MAMRSAVRPAPILGRAGGYVRPYVCVVWAAALASVCSCYQSAAPHEPADGSAGNGETSCPSSITPYSPLGFDARATSIEGVEGSVWEVSEFEIIVAYPDGQMVSFFWLGPDPVEHIAQGSPATLSRAGYSPEVDILQTQAARFVTLHEERDSFLPESELPAELGLTMSYERSCAIPNSEDCTPEIRVQQYAVTLGYDGAERTFEIGESGALGPTTVTLLNASTAGSIHCGNVIGEGYARLIMTLLTTTDP